MIMARRRLCAAITLCVMSPLRRRTPPNDHYTLLFILENDRDQNLPPDADGLANVFEFNSACSVVSARNPDSSGLLPVRKV